MINKFDGEHRFLSNFWEVPITYERRTYSTVEHAYQASKTIYPEERIAIRDAETPAKAKRLGKLIIYRADWEDIKLDVMEALVRQKFTEHHMLADKLIATGDHELVEGNWWGDTYWGVCKGIGENHLGKILMKVRSELRDQRSV